MQKLILVLVLVFLPFLPGMTAEVASESKELPEWKFVEQAVEMSDAPVRGTFRLFWNNPVDNREGGEDKPWVRTEAELISWRAPWIKDDEQVLTAPAATGYPVGVTTTVVALDQRFMLVISDWQDYGSGSNGDHSLYLWDRLRNRFTGGVHRSSPGHKGWCPVFWWPAEKVLLISGNEPHSALWFRLPAADKDADVSTLAQVWQAGKNSTMPVPPAASFDYSDVFTIASDGILLEYFYSERDSEGLLLDTDGHIKNHFSWQLLGVSGPPDDEFMRPPAYKFVKDKVPDEGVLNPRNYEWNVIDEAGREIALPSGFSYGFGICAGGVWRLDNGILGWSANEEAESRMMKKFLLPPILAVDEVASDALLLTTPYSIIAFWPQMARGRVLQRHQQVPAADEKYPYFLETWRLSPREYLVLEHVKAGDYGTLSRMLSWTVETDPFAADAK